MKFISGSIFLIVIDKRHLLFKRTKNTLNFSKYAIYSWIVRYFWSFNIILLSIKIECHSEIKSHRPHLGNESSVPHCVISPCWLRALSRSTQQKKKPAIMHTRTTRFFQFLLLFVLFYFCSSHTTLRKEKIQSILFTAFFIPFLHHFLTHFTLYCLMKCVTTRYGVDFFFLQFNNELLLC